MTKEECREITTYRFEQWVETATEYNATPILVLTIGHGISGGQTHVITVEGVSDAYTLALLEHAVKLLKKKLGT